jgi:integrase
MDSYVGDPRVAWDRIVRERLTERNPMTDWSKATPTKIPNVYAIEGGHLVRARVMDPVTGKLREVKKVLPGADAATALKWLEDERARIKSGVPLPQIQRTRFAEFVRSLFEEKVGNGDIRSAKGRERWAHTLEHLISGTTGPKSERYVAGFGDMFIDKLHPSHVDEWKLGIAGLIEAGDYKPTTANGWLSILRVVAKAAARKYDLPRSFADGISDFDVSEHDPYPEEEPNALLPEQVPLFLAAMRETYPQHYAMTFLEFATGLRPSSLRPLRRGGQMPDVLWDTGRLLVRRSVTLGEVMNTTKTKRRYVISLPREVMDVLVWHVETQLTTPEMRESELLFPAITGGFRSPSVLNKPFEDVASTLGLPPFTQRGLRRTFQDLCREAQVEDVVKRSISGHGTKKMGDHYSTVNAVEQQRSIAKGDRPVRQRQSYVSSVRDHRWYLRWYPTRGRWCLNEKSRLAR